MRPPDANAGGAVFGGVILAQCDEAAGIAAMRWCRRRVVTAAVDAVEFLAPGDIGDVLTCRARVNAVFASSVEVGVRVEAEDAMTGESRHVSSAYFVMVALGDDGRPDDSVPGDLPLGDEDARRRHAEAQERHRARRG
jgi:acyl-CoA hydrolase